MFERFSDSARKSIVYAQEEALKHKTNQIGVEFLFLGLLDLDDSFAAAVLNDAGINVEVVRAWFAQCFPGDGHTPAGHIPFTREAKQMLELSLREALQLGHNWIGQEHLLLASIRPEDGIIAEIVEDLGSSRHRIRQLVIQRLSGYSGPKNAVEITFSLTEDVVGDFLRWAREAERLNGARFPTGHPVAKVLDALKP
jgi:ATP-dependent Clp protease ATP-binding subunit ClpC